MNLLGKIFTVLIFVMSIVFMSLSLMVFATHKNWKQAAIGVNPKNPGLKMQLEQERNKVVAVASRYRTTQDQNGRGTGRTGVCFGGITNEARTA